MKDNISCSPRDIAILGTYVQGYVQDTFVLVSRVLSSYISCTEGTAAFLEMAGQAMRWSGKYEIRGNQRQAKSTKDE